jgi:uncharacterized protein YhaN
MKIIELHIYGYGKLENFHISSLNKLQVFYGENEAGKSTIMSFIHSILFGFPAKQSAELRYEPKINSKYGGKIKAFFPDIGIAVIERVKGKTSGDVTVSLEDGTIGGEELLKDLLQRMDKSIFQAIFSFNVHGLQNIQAMKGEELGKYLFSAGTLGTDKLFNTESTLVKEMEQRFKPSGKKPSLNEKLKELKDVQATLKDAEQQNERYSVLLGEKDALTNKVTQLQTEIGELEQRAAKLREYKRYEQLVIEEAGLQRRLEEHGPVYFPQDGLIRFEKIKQHLKPIHARMLWIKDKQDSLLKEAEFSKPDADLLEMETEIESRLENLPLYDQLKQEKRLLESKVDEINEEISQINDNLHIEFNEENIQEINTSVFLKEQAETIQHGQQRLFEKKLELESGFDEEKSALVELEATATSIKKEMLAEDRRIQLTKDLEVLENKEQIQSELNHVKEQIIAHKTRMKNEETRRTSQRKKDFYQLLLLGGILLVVSVWGIADSKWFLSAVGLAGMLILLAIHFKTSVHENMMLTDEVLTELLNRENTLSELVTKQPAGNLFSIKNQLVKDDELRQRHRELLVKIEQQHARYEKVLLQFEKWESDEAELKQKKTALMEQLGIKENTVPIKLFDAFLLVDKQKQFFRERKRKQERLEDVKAALTEMQASLDLLAERFLQNKYLAPVETASLLKRKLREAIDQKARYNEITFKMKELEEEYASLEKEELILTEEIESLLAQAKASDEDEFRLQATNVEKVKGWASRLDDMNHQLAASGITSIDREHILNGPDLEDEINEKAVAIEQRKKELSDQFDRLASVKHNMVVLEEGGLYSELLHKYKQLQHEFAEDAKEWAKYAIAKDLLSRTIDRYKDERMPRMLAKAESFLSILTDGSYVRIIPQVSGSGFLIERNDHLLYEANELSQATAEQVYVSIRLALAAVHYDRYPFPVIIDDSFVNFDHNRTARIIRLLREMSNNQILIFTCHRHLLEYFSDEEILNLEEKSTNAV